MKDGAEIHVIPADAIDFVEAQDDYVAIHVGAKSWLKPQPLAELAASLDPARFVRVHRSVIVNASMIRTVEKWFHGEYSIEMHSGRRFTSGRIYRQRIQGLVLRRRGHPESDSEVD